MKTIGIIGGMGPEATAALYLEIVHIFQKEHNARYDADYPPMVIYNLPAPDVVERLEDEAKLIDMLKGATKKVADAGADFFLLACNTVQKYLPELAKEVTIPAVDLNREVALQARRKQYECLGILGTEATLAGGHLQATCEKEGIDCLLSDTLQRRDLTDVIMNILSGNPRPDSKRFILGCIEALGKRGAQAVVLACTDLRLVLKGQIFSVPTIDTVDVLAQVAVSRSVGTK